MTTHETPPALPARVVVLGVTGSGKTTAGRRIADAIGAKHIELDSLFHGPNWTPAEPDEFRAKISAAIDGVDRWVADGNYTTMTSDILWTRADAIVWLDYPLPLSLVRLLRRTMTRAFRQEELWNGNKESLRQHFASTDSLFVWAFKSRAKQKRTLPERFARPEYADREIVRARTPRQLDRWIAGLARR